MVNARAQRTYFSNIFLRARAQQYLEEPPSPGFRKTRSQEECQRSEGGGGGWFTCVHAGNPAQETLSSRAALHKDNTTGFVGPATNRRFRGSLTSMQASTSLS